MRLHYRCVASKPELRSKETDIESRRVCTTRVALTCPLDVDAMGSLCIGPCDNSIGYTVKLES